MHYRKALVTGGAGFIGSHIVDELLRTELCESIVIVDNLTRGTVGNLAAATSRNSVSFVEGDIRDRALMSRLMDGTDLLFHQAALRITQCAQEPRAALDVMVTATFDLLELAANCGVRRVVAASSASVYGMADRFPTPEHAHPYDNRTLYGAAKLFNEGLLRSFHDMHGLPYVALRYFNAYGPRMDIHGVFTEVLVRWIERIDRGLPPLIFGDGEQSMDFVHVADIARANVLAARSAMEDEVFNVGSQVETTLNQLARCLLRVMGSALVPEYGPERKVNPVRRRLADAEKARRLLGFQAQIGLEEGLASLVDWWRSETRRGAPA